MRRDQSPFLDLLHALVESSLTSLRTWWLRATPMLVGIANDSVPLSVVFAGVGFLCGLLAGILIAGNVLVGFLVALVGGALGVAACRGLERSGAGPWQRLAALVVGCFVGLLLLGRYLAP